MLSHLHESVIHSFLGPILLRENQWSEYRTFFTPAEWNHILSLRNPFRRWERIFGRLWLKKNIAPLLSITNLCEIEFSNELQCLSHQLPFLYSLSHSSGWFFGLILKKDYALNKQLMGLGCDIEGTERLGSQFLKIFNNKDHYRNEDKEYLWSVKEACYKALPPGKCQKLSEIEVNLAQGIALHGQDAFRIHTFRSSKLVGAIVLSVNGERYTPPCFLPVFANRQDAFQFYQDSICKLHEVLTRLGSVYFCPGTL